MPSGGDKSLEDSFFAHEVHLNRQALLQQFQYGVFFSYIKLKEQEVCLFFNLFYSVNDVLTVRRQIRNIVWIAECIAQQQKDRINNYINIF